MPEVRLDIVTIEHRLEEADLQKRDSGDSEHSISPEGAVLVSSQCNGDGHSAWMEGGMNEAFRWSVGINFPCPARDGEKVLEQCWAL